MNVQYSALKPASKMVDSWQTTIQFMACSAGVNHIFFFTFYSFQGDTAGFWSLQIDPVPENWSHSKLRCMDSKLWFHLAQISCSSTGLISMWVPKGNKALYSSYFTENCMPDAMEIHMICAKNRKGKQKNNYYYNRSFNGILEFSAFLWFQKKLRYAHSVS